MVELASMKTTFFYYLLYLLDFSLVQTSVPVVPEAGEWAGSIASDSSALPDSENRKAICSIFYEFSIYLLSYLLLFPPPFFFIISFRPACHRWTK